MTAPALQHRLDRTVVIAAMPDVVFRYFTDTPRWAAWWGAGSTVDPSPGGEVYIRHPNGIESRGQVLEVTPPRRFVFTYGFVSGTPIPAGSSRVTIALEPDPAGTRLVLSHELADRAARDEHVQGWRFQLSLFANVVTNEVNAHAAAAVDRWFEVWAEPDPERRRATLEQIAVPDVRMHDRFSNLHGFDDVLPHITASQRFMPGMRLQREGEVRHCQGMVLADWSAMGADGQRRGAGTNVFIFGPAGRIEWVTGFWQA